ncbi:DDE superfamily endonuclease, CENP-B-like [Phytophthora cinnamomi]|uniref:DDE superfamily endonuclease, CENP-B-like n=1 Tax=Phytophthora cinnamomi TaxID=4785 RepID=UPI0035594BB9|nr:DDE superfamily endonuclease, CENP-B-like [Phytophthora cinnamomi]
MEDALYDEIVAKRLRKEKVTRAWIGHMARVIYASHHDDDAVFGGFAASPHWITGFMRRYGLSLRRRTNLTTLTDETLVERAVSYMKFLRSAVPAMDLNRTILMDETAVYFEDARNQTVDITGSRHVVVRSTGFSSMRITAVLAVSATGRKLPPLLIWKGKASPTFAKIGGMYVAHQPRAWVDSTLLKRWIDLAFPLVDMRAGKHLFWDSMRAHISKDVKAKCATRKINLCVISGSLTP